MPDLLLELFSEEIPARMQRQAADDHGAGFRQQDRAVAIDLEGVVEPVLAGQHDLQHVAHAERGQGRLQRG